MYLIVSIKSIKSFLYLIFLQNYTMICGHYDLFRVVVEEICLENFTFCFRYDIMFIALNYSTHIPDHCILTKSTDDKSFKTFFALVKFCWEKFEIFDSILLNIIQRNFQFNWSWPYIKSHFLAEQRIFIVIFSWNESKVTSEGGKNPFSVFSSI